MKAFKSNINGLETFFVKEEGDKVLLFLHGWGQDHTSLLKLYEGIKAYNSQYGMIALDFWGFGNSQTPKTAWGVVDYSLALYELLKQELPTKKVVIIAHSFGGRVAICLSSLYPELVEKVVLIGSAGIKRQSIKVKINIILYKLKKKFNIKSKNINNHASADYLNVNTQLKKTFVKIVNEKINRYAKNVKTPTLLIYGEKDSQTPVKSAKRLNKLIKNSQLIVLKNLTHFCFLENLTAVTNIICCFL